MRKARTAYWWLRLSIPLVVVAVPGIVTSFLAGSRGASWAGPIAVVSVILLAASIGCLMRSLVVRYREFSRGYTTLPGFKDRYRFVGRIGRAPDLPIDPAADRNVAVNTHRAGENSPTIHRISVKHVALSLATLALVLGAFRMGVFASEVSNFGWIVWPFIALILLLLVLTTWLTPDAVKASQDLRDVTQHDSGRAFLVLVAHPLGAVSILGREDVGGRKRLVLVVDDSGIRLWLPGEPGPLMVWNWDQVVSLRTHRTEGGGGCIVLVIRGGPSQIEYRFVPRTFPFVNFSTSMKHANRMVQDITVYMPA